MEKKIYINKKVKESDMSDLISFNNGEKLDFHKTNQIIHIYESILKQFNNDFPYLVMSFNKVNYIIFKENNQYILSFIFYIEIDEIAFKELKFSLYKSKQDFLKIKNNADLIYDIPLNQDVFYLLEKILTLKTINDKDKYYLFKYLLTIENDFSLYLRKHLNLLLELDTDIIKKEQTKRNFLLKIFKKEDDYKEILFKNNLNTIENINYYKFFNEMISNKKTYYEKEFLTIKNTLIISMKTEFNIFNLFVIKIIYREFLNLSLKNIVSDNELTDLIIYIKNLLIYYDSFVKDKNKGVYY